MVQNGAVWPVFRHDTHNTGRSRLTAEYQGDAPWMFQTGKGIFSTPVIDRDGTVFIGSADHAFYALGPDGSPRWRFQTGGIIDSAAALPDADDEIPATVIVPSGDGNLYCVHCGTGEVIWTFEASRPSKTGYNNWWEANVALGPRGTIYAGNTNFNYYALEPGGTLRWAYETGANAWSAAAIADDGTIYWGSNDGFVHAVHPNGERLWRKRTLGFIAASAAIGSDGTVYIGSFDSQLYALDPRKGRVRWKFRTQDHVYSSAALSIDAAGRTNAIIFGSADGHVYAVDSRGELLWRYNTGAPVRSSPVLGRKPAGEEGWIAYVGSGNGKLYALDAATGARRWSYDTTPAYPPLRNRNDLNGSPALGRTGIYIAGEHGQVWYVPYDYPLHSDDARGRVDPGEDVPHVRTALYHVAPGGNLRLDPPEDLPTATVITLQLVSGGTDTPRDTRLFNRLLPQPRKALEITTDPAFAFDAEISADGRYLHIIPDSFLTPDQSYTIHIEADTYTGGLHIGNLTIGGKKSGHISQDVTFRTEAPVLDRLPLQATTEEVSAIELTRFAVPIPTMLPSLNQIGFDNMAWIASVVDMSEPDDQGEGQLILWAIGGRRDDRGILVVDPLTDLQLPLSGRYSRDAFEISSEVLKMRITGIPITFDHLELRGQLGADLQVGENATGFATAKALSIPTFGPLMMLTGLADKRQKLTAMTTFLTQPYNDGPANRRPLGIHMWGVNSERPTARQDGYVLAQFTCDQGTTYQLTQHLPAIVLIDEERGAAVPLDYSANLTASAHRNGNLRAVSLSIPAGTELSETISVVVMLDLFPMHRERLT